MKFRGELRGQVPAGRGVARAATRTGIENHELVKEAVQLLLASGRADRIGVWIEVEEPNGFAGHGLTGFRGMVADRDGESTPVEWEVLSPEAALPPEILNDGNSVEQDLDGSSSELTFGALVDIQRAVWVPVESRGHLRGVMLAGLRTKRGVLPTLLLESVSAELALALELDCERRKARERQADLAEVARALAEVAQAGATDAMLTGLMSNCTHAGAAGLGAVFAVLRAEENPTSGFVCESSARENSETSERIRAARIPARECRTFSWQSGDPAWVHAIRSQPLSFVWLRVREAAGTITIPTGAERVSWPRGDVARIVAIPLRAAGEKIGTFVAGFRHESISQSAIERLESRAGLAATVLGLRGRSEEAALHQARQHALLQASSAATILVDDGGRIAAMSRSAEKLLGEIQKETVARAPANAPPLRRFPELFRAREQQRVETWLHRVRLAPGDQVDDDRPEAELWSAVRARLSHSPLGGGLSAISLEPLGAQDAGLRRDRAEAQLFNVIEWLEEGVVLFDTQHDIRAMNTRFAQIAGLAPEDVGKIATLDALIARLSGQTAEPEKFAKRWRELARGADSGVREEIQLLRPVPCVLERAARPVVDADGRRLGRVEIYRDLTAQRVFQSKLLQTEKLAALGQMVTSVAHELSNPLTSILGYAQRLFLRQEPEGQPDEIRQIFQEAERASTILRQLLMSAHESRPERRRVSLNQVVTRTMDLQKLNLAAERVAVELDLDPGLPFVLGDAGQLQQVLMNLIGNARQAIEQRGKGGTIRLSTKFADANRARLEIGDDGPGIPPAIASRIFDPFFTTKPAGIGTGLGLAIVLGVVREHGGQVRVSSPPSGGAVFSLEFPAVPAESRASSLPATGSGRSDRVMAPVRKLLAPEARMGSSPALANAQTVATSAGQVRGTGARVLVVEDEPTVARLIGDVLEDEGFQVDALLDGHEALRRAAQEPYDLVICDMKMPGLDGQQFYKTLVTTGNPLWKRFLFVTGDVLAAGTHEFLECHRVPHVAKPFRVEELTEKVRRVLSQVPASQLPGELPARVNVARK